jgi:hypothetical protein
MMNKVVKGRENMRESAREFYEPGGGFSLSQDQ